MSSSVRAKRGNSGLPTRWEWHGGKIHYQIPPNKAGHAAFGGRKRRILLGATLTEAYGTWAEIQKHFADRSSIERFKHAVLAYLGEEVPTLAPKTQRDYKFSCARLNVTFQDFSVHDIEPHHCYAYVDANMRRIRQARYDIRVLSSILSWCVSKGIMKANPLVGQLRFKHKRYNPPKRRHYVEDADLRVFLNVLEPKWRLYVLLKLKTGQSQQTLLTSKWEHVSDQGIFFMRAKTGARISMKWDSELRDILDQLRSLRQGTKSEYLFATRQGGCYYNMQRGSADGFRSMWRRWQDKAMAEGMKQRFTEHQLRHKAASDNPLSAASAALGHADERITRDVYQVQEKRVAPLGMFSPDNAEKL